MKFAPILNLLFAAVTLAAPLQKQAENVRNDVVDGICKPVTVIYARGTGEDGWFPCRPPPQTVVL
jgi:hypothetical protein